MGGINTLSGLNNVRVGFRPTIPVNAPKTGNANQPLPGADAVPEAAAQVKAIGKVLVEKNVLTQGEVSK